MTSDEYLHVQLSFIIFFLQVRQQTVLNHSVFETFKNVELDDQDLSVTLALCLQYSPYLQNNDITAVLEYK